MSKFQFTCEVWERGASDRCGRATPSGFICQKHRDLARRAGIRFGRPGHRSTGRLWASKFRWMLPEQPGYVIAVMVEEFGRGVMDAMREAEKIRNASRGVS